MVGRRGARTELSVLRVCVATEQSFNEGKRQAMDKVEEAEASAQASEESRTGDLRHIVRA